MSENQVKLVCTRDCQLFLNGNELKNCKEGSTYSFDEPIAKKLLSVGNRKFMTVEMWKDHRAYLDKLNAGKYEEGKKPRSAPKAPHKED